MHNPSIILFFFLNLRDILRYFFGLPMAVWSATQVLAKPLMDSLWRAEQRQWVYYGMVLGNGKAHTMNIPSIVFLYTNLPTFYSLIISVSTHSMIINQLTTTFTFQMQQIFNMCTWLYS